MVTGNTNNSQSASSSPFSYWFCPLTFCLLRYTFTFKIDNYCELFFYCKRTDIVCRFPIGLYCLCLLRSLKSVCKRLTLSTWALPWNFFFKTCLWIHFAILKPDNNCGEIICSMFGLNERRAWDTSFIGIYYYYLSLTAHSTQNPFGSVCETWTTVDRSRWSCLARDKTICQLIVVWCKTLPELRLTFQAESFTFNALTDCNMWSLQLHLLIRY